MAEDIVLELKLPENFKEGTAIGGGDCFYDAVAQGLGQIMPQVNFTVKSLRTVCKEVATQDEQLQNEVKSHIVRDARNRLDTLVVMPATDVSDDDIWNAYLASIEYTSDEIMSISFKDPHLYQSLTDLKYGSTLRVPIWGRPEIEGRLICIKYNIRLHLEEKHPDFGYMSQIVDYSGSRSRELVTTSAKSESTGFENYEEENTIHIVNHNAGHFQPILRCDTDTSLHSGIHGTVASINIDFRNISIPSGLAGNFNRESAGNLKRDYCRDFSENLLREETFFTSSQPKNPSLLPKLPKNFEVGRTDGGADCFFNAVAQGLGQIKPEIKFTVKSLRSACKEIAEKDWVLKEEIMNEIVLDARAAYYVDDPSKTPPASNISDGMLLNAYLERIDYTVDEVQRLRDENPNLYESLTNCRCGSTLQAPIPGRPDVDGYLITKRYGIKLHYLIKNNMDGGFHSFIVGQSNSWGEANDYFGEENMIHLISHDFGHFEPILRVT